MVPVFLQKWIFLNLLRLLTIVSCALVIASTSLLMQRNFANAKKDDFANEIDDEYYAGTDIPAHTWGPLWSSLHHVYNIIILFLVILSEVSWGGILDRFFKNILPFLGNHWGTGMLGGLLILLGADTLSRSIGRFPLISNWLLISVGVVNVFSGLVFRARAKLLRSPKGFRKPVAEKLELLADARAKAEKLRDTILPISAPVEQEKRQSVGAPAIDKGKGLSTIPPAPVAGTANEHAAIPPAIPFRPPQQLSIPIPEIQRPAPVANRSVDSTQFSMVNAPSVEVRRTSAEIVEDRSPGLVASWRAAALEAQIKARTRATKKNLYLGSEEWKRSSSTRDEDSASLPPYASSRREEKRAPSRAESRHPPRSESRQTDAPPRSQSRTSERPSEFRSDSRQSHRRHPPSRSESRSENHYPSSRSESRSERRYESRSESRQTDRRYEPSHSGTASERGYAPSSRSGSQRRHGDRSLSREQIEFGRYRRRRASSLDRRRPRSFSSYYSEDEEWLSSPMPPHRGYDSDTPSRSYR